MINDHTKITNPKCMACLWIVYMLCLTTATAYGFPATVVAVDNGDTLVVVSNGERRTVRLYGIDAPVSGQQDANAAKRYLRSIALSSPVDVEVVSTDVFGRSVAIVRRAHILSSVNAAIVANGYAWVNPKTCRKDKCEKWRRLERQAKNYHMGIWSGYDLIPPWEFKQQQRR